MTRCSVCARPDAGSINVLLAEGRSARSVAAAHGVSEDAMQRHRTRHVRPGSRPNRAPDPDRHPHLDDPLDELVTALRVRALAGNPSDTREYRLALAAQSDARHQAPPTRSLETEPEWLALRTRLLDALRPHPEALAAVLGALGES